MTVLAVITVLVAQIVAAASASTGMDRRRLACSREARLVFDRLALDLGQALRRRDVAFRVDKDAGNDRLTFFSVVPGRPSTDANPVSLVSYAVDNRGRLVRASAHVPWDEVTFDATSPLPPASPGNQRVLGASVFRFEVDLVLAGDYRTPAAPTSDPRRFTRLSAPPVPANGGRWVEDLRGIVVTLALLDETARTQSGGDPDAPVISAFDDSSFAPVLAEAGQSEDAGSLSPAAEAWEQRITSDIAALPLAARQQIRIYSRWIPVP